MKNQKIISEKNIFSTALGTVVKAMLFTALALLVLTVFMAYGKVSYEVARACASVATFVSVFFAGFMTAARRKSSGLLSGLIAGIIYVLLMLFLGFLIIGNFAVSGDTVKMFLLSVAGSMLGGIFGVNLKKRK